MHAGAIRPLLAEPHPAAFVHGESGLDGADLPEPARGADSDDAVGYIVDTCRAQEGLWLVPTGPLTNIALAMRAAPDLASRVAGVSLMGGGSFGNRSAVAEFNIWADPEAAAMVFASGVPLVMAGLDVTHQFLVQASGDDTLRGLVFDISRRNVWPAPFTGRCLMNDHARHWTGRELELMRDASQG